MSRGTFLVVDGADGAGKDTQAEQLVTSARMRGMTCSLFAFPDYQSPVGKDIVAYQSGEFGELDDVNPRLASYLYAVNRHERQKDVLAALAQNDLVVAARYAPSNVAYMSARVSESEKRAYQEWLERLDYEILGNPREDAVVYLDLPIKLSDKLIAKRNLSRRDINDENRSYRSAVRSQYLSLVAERKNWYAIDCASQSGDIRTIEDIAQDLSTLVFDTIMTPKKETVEALAPLRSSDGATKGQA